MEDQDWIEISFRDHRGYRHSIRLLLPDLRNYEGKMSIHSMLSHRLYGLCDTIHQIIEALKNRGEP